MFDMPDETAGAVLEEDVPAFTQLYIFQRDMEDPGGSSEPGGWYQVGHTVDQASGWMRAKDVVEWRHSLISAFTHPGEGADARTPVIFFDTAAALSEITYKEGDERATASTVIVDGLNAAMAGSGEVPASVVSVEPGPFVDIDSVFYMLPIIAFEAYETETGDYARDLQVMAAAGTRAKPNQTMLPQNLPGQAIPARPSGSVGIDVVFVVDMTISMIPFIQQTIEVMRGVSSQLGAKGERIRFGLVGYRDNHKTMPALEFTTKTYNPLGMVPAQEFVTVLESAMTDMSAMVKHPEFKNTRNDITEEVFAGLAQAVNVPWSEDAARFVLLIGDSDGHVPGSETSDQYRATTNDTPESVRLLMDQNKIYLMAFHLKAGKDAANEASTQAQFSQVSVNAKAPEKRPYYFPIDATDEAAYSEMVSIATKTIAEVLMSPADAGETTADESGTGGGSGLEVSDSGSVEAEGAPKNGEVSSDPEARIRALARAAMLPILSLQAGVEPPRDFTAWVTDRDLIDPRRRALDVRILITRPQLSNLRTTVDSIVKSLQQQEITQEEFFAVLQTTAAAAGVDTDNIDLRRINTLRGSGLTPTWIEALPYRSRILEITKEEYARLTQQERDEIVSRMSSLRQAYSGLLESPDIWIALSDQAVEEARVVPLRLDLLP